MPLLLPMTLFAVSPRHTHRFLHEAAELVLARSPDAYIYLASRTFPSLPFLLFSFPHVTPITLSPFPLPNPPVYIAKCLLLSKSLPPLSLDPLERRVWP
jgi:hypothetical protein